MNAVTSLPESNFQESSLECFNNTPLFDCFNFHPEATAASAAGLHAYLVVRSDSDKPDESNKAHFPAIKSLTELLEGDDAEGIPEKKACRVDPKPAEVSKVHH